MRYTARWKHRVPGSLTKGDLDVQVRVTSSKYDAAKEVLSKLYRVNFGGFASADATSFEDYTTQPSLGVHLTVIDSSADIQWRFRDLLIASPALREEYDQRRFDGGSMAKYRDDKATFVERVLRDAGVKHPSKSGARFKRQPHNKQLERTVIRRRVRAACAPLHYAHAARWTARRAAAQLRR